MKPPGCTVKCFSSDTGTDTTISSSAWMLCDIRGQILGPCACTACPYHSWIIYLAPNLTQSRLHHKITYIQIRGHLTESSLRARGCTIPRISQQAQSSLLVRLHASLMIQSHQPENTLNVLQQVNECTVAHPHTVECCSLMKRHRPPMYILSRSKRLPAMLIHLSSNFTNMKLEVRKPVLQNPERVHDY